MPLSDCTCKVINGKTGYVRDNSSWIIGRIVRDFEGWMDEGKKGGKIRKQLDEMIQARWQMDKEAAEKKAKESGKLLEPVKRPTQAGLCVSVYKAEKAQPGYPGYDLVYFIGFATILVQLGIAAIPCGLFGDWGILLVTICGIILSLATGSLGQWSEEKWACRKKSKKTVILTRGNGSQHAIVIMGDGKGLDLEDLAAGPTNVDVSASKWTRAAIIILAIFWILLLITAAGIKQNTWFLLAIGGVGILQNIYVAGRMRFPVAFGVPLKFEGVIGEAKVMKTLFAVEEKYPRLGKSLLDMFFPGKLWPEEYQKWEEFERKAIRVEREEELAELKKAGKLEKVAELEDKMWLEEAAAVRLKEAFKLEEAARKEVAARLKDARGGGWVEGPWSFSDEPTRPL
jgi:hypothetical protein